MKAIIFDLFGTLVYLEKETNPYLKAYRQWFSEVMDYSDFRRAAMTNDYDSISTFGRDVGLQVAELKALDAEVEEEVDSIRLFGDVEEVLESLSRRTNLYVLSNIATQYIKGYDKLSLNQWIKQPYFSSKIGYVKPEPEIFEHVLTELQIDKKDVLMVGDSFRADYLGAKEFGIEAVWLNRNKEGQGEWISDLRELSRYLDQ